jgi:hypothetical protein
MEHHSLWWSRGKTLRQNKHKMQNKHLQIIARLGVQTCLDAAAHARNGEGCATVAALLGLHWRTASAAMDAGAALPSVS